MSMYKICFVPTCPNTRTNSPDKTFVYVSDSLKSRWCTENNFDYVSKYCFCCEDHLDLQKDLTNYGTWKLTNAKPILKSTANLLLNRQTLDVVNLDDSEKCPDPLRLIYIKKCDSKNKLEPFPKNLVKSGTTVNVSSQSKVQMVNRSTHKVQHPRSSKTLQAFPIRPRRQLAEIPEPPILPSPKSNQTFVISPLASNNAVSIKIQCKAETEDRGTTSENTCEQPDKALAVVNNTDASSQCTLLTAAGISVKPRKSRFSKSFIKRYDLVQDKRKIIPSTLKIKNSYNRPMRTVQSTSGNDNQSTSGTQKTRSSRPTTKKDDLSQDQGKTCTPKSTASVSLQSRLRIRSRDSTCESGSSIKTKPPSTSKTDAKVDRHSRNTIVCAKQNRQISRSSLQTGTQIRRRPAKRKAHVSIQVDSREFLVRSSAVTRTKGKSLSPPSVRSRVSSHGAGLNRIVIRIPRTNNFLT